MTVKHLKILHQHNANTNQTFEKDGHDVVQGLTKTRKNLPPKYFYDDRGSELFEQICDLPEYYPTRTEAWILNQYANEIATITGSCELVELGSGSSTKTHYLLNAYQKVASSLTEVIPDAFSYIPIDVSGGILKTTVLHLQQKYPDLSIEGLIGTYDEALFHLGKNHLRSRMIFFLGSSIGNFTESESNDFLGKVSHALTQGDYFLLGIDLQKPKEILEAAYNDSQEVTAAFNLNMLAHLNWRFQGDFDLDLFKHQAIYNEVDHQIEMYLHARSPHQASLEILDLKVQFEAGESILTEISRKFDLEKVQAQLRSQGLETVKIWTDPQKWFGLVLCQVPHN
ncbi:L-histidine N(alpha)-methyltransferase [Phormidium tenue]|jgi:dimethylhistidine N-methyltransferase|uniref:L-histidine N(Alpha)-methyltransferase n=1 Tax=Phormidium tenue FACHB-1050 TaxID=2692857 RepID=A0ABR8CBF1_9CYAN|nr:L-histidine N(alpha)-methyltransferase [Phormidium tenue]MBD2316769.1 L-histidine N(alpha)-methyltransferase [Phormidium tenue FACHB-1050]